MLYILCFCLQKEDAHNALIQNDMNLQGAIADLYKGNNKMPGNFINLFVGDPFRISFVTNSVYAPSNVMLYETWFRDFS